MFVSHKLNQDGGKGVLEGNLTHTLSDHLLLLRKPHEEFTCVISTSALRGLPPSSRTYLAVGPVWKEYSGNYISAITSYRPEADLVFPHIYQKLSQTCFPEGSAGASEGAFTSLQCTASASGLCCRASFPSPRPCPAFLLSSRPLCSCFFTYHISQFSSFCIQTLSIPVYLPLIIDLFSKRAPPPTRLRKGLRVTVFPCYLSVTR